MNFIIPKGFSTTFRDKVIELEMKHGDSSLIAKKITNGDNKNHINYFMDRAVESKKMLNTESINKSLTMASTLTSDEKDVKLKKFKNTIKKHQKQEGKMVKTIVKLQNELKFIRKFHTEHEKQLEEYIKLKETFKTMKLDHYDKRVAYSKQSKQMDVLKLELKCIKSDYDKLVKIEQDNRESSESDFKEFAKDAQESKNTIKTLTSNIIELEDAKNDALRIINEKESDILNKDKTIESLNKKIASFDETIESLNTRIGNLDKMVDQQNVFIVEQNKIIVERPKIRTSKRKRTTPMRYEPTHAKRRKYK